MRALIILIVSAACASTPALAQTRELDEAANRQLVRVTGDLYRFNNGNQQSLLLVTRDGILVVDPLGLYAASWLNKELQTRFPNTRVRYAVLTHHHAERAGGAGLLKPETVVAHESFAAALSDSSRYSSTDYQYVRGPQTTFRDRHTIEIGGHRLELIHTGPFHSRDSIAVIFTQERVLFAADAPPAGNVPFAFGRLSAANVVTWLNAIARADVDTVMFGDGTTMPRAEIASLAAYLSKMRGAVLAGYERGHSVEKTLATVRLEGHRTSPHYAGREQQITDMYRQVRFVRGDVILSGIANALAERDSQFCAGYDHCESGGVVPAGTAAGLVSFGRRFGVQVEFVISDQFWSSRAKPLYDEETVLRPFLTSGLVRFNVTRSRTISLLAGVARLSGDVKGVDRVSGVFTPNGGRHRIQGSDVRKGFTGGLEFSQRLGALRLVVPLRVTYFNATRPEFWPSQLNASAGVGLAIPLFRVLE